MRATLILAAIAVLTAGCASGPQLIDASQEQAPKWLNKTPYRLAGKHYYVGRANGARSTEDALQLSRSDAIRSLVGELGVTVSEESKAFQEEHNGAFQYDVQLQVQTRSEPVKIRNMVVVERYTETWTRTATETDGWVLMMIPDADFQRAKREAAARILIVFQCDADPSSLCQDRLLDGVRAALATAQRPVVPKVVNGPLKKSAQAVGISNHAAYVLTVKLESSFLSEMDGEFYASSSATAELLDTGDNKVLNSVETGLLKGGHFSRDKAVATALKEAAKSLASRLNVL
jgi:hypothetical protein